MVHQQNAEIVPHPYIVRVEPERLAQSRFRLPRTTKGVHQQNAESVPRRGTFRNLPDDLTQGLLRLDIKTRFNVRRRGLFLCRNPTIVRSYR